jgi:hypothetical protein
VESGRATPSVPSSAFHGEDRRVLPGPARSQVGIAVGLMRAGLLGSVAAWLGFTLPSALALMAFAYGLQMLGITEAGWLHGLKVLAVAMVTQAVWGMARTLAPGRQMANPAFLAALTRIYPRHTRRSGGNGLPPSGSRAWPSGRRAFPPGRRTPRL